MAVSKIRQNYHEDCEALINKQINMEFYASYVYLSMVSMNMNLTFDLTSSYRKFRAKVQIDTKALVSYHF